MKTDIKTFDYVVVGAGSGGLLVAVGLLRLGKNVAVISENIGGDCTHFGCVPSKTLLHLAKQYIQESNPDHKTILKNIALKTVQQTIASFADEEKTIIPNDRLFTGTAEFVDSHTLRIKQEQGEQLVRFSKKCVIATGSSPIQIDMPGVPKGKIITNEEFFYLKTLPKSISIIGGGPIGAELATACASFGIETHLISRSYLSKEPQLIAKQSLELLKKSGAHHHPIDDNSSIPETQYYLLALGRSPNTNLGLEQAHVTYDKSGIAVDQNLTTTNPAIFAIGDCTQNPQFTHLAANHGKFVIKKIMVPFARRRDRALPRVTFVSPSIASVGSLEQTNSNHLFELDFTHLDRARTNFNDNSRGLILVDTRTGLILGASLLGDFSEELISVITLMMDEQIPVLHMTDFITPYPTYGNILHNLSRDYMSYLSQHWKKHPTGSVKQFISYLLH
jgi:pyruvate/2-oxoglutarate dehydrogenase complex dihydrolipoamide dehydrogenase (E3) component